MQQSLEEEWRTFPLGDYEVSSHGRVRRATPGRRTWPGRLMALVSEQCGYLAVRPTEHGRNVHHYVHDLVAAAFLGTKPSGAHVNHIDGQKHNNHVSNLEYCSRAQNMAHASANGLMCRGSRHPAAKLTEQDVEDIRDMRAQGHGLTEICARFGIGKPAASQIISRQRWRHVP